MAERLESPTAGSPDGDGGGISVSSPTAGGRDTGPDQARSRRRRKRRLAVSAVLLTSAAVAAVVLLSSRSEPHHGAGSGLPPGQTASVVSRRTLTESATVEGTLGYGATLDLYNRLSGTFSWLPALGEVIRRGETLYRIDNRPVALMYGPVPAYRALKEGVSDGPDVAELNRNLIDLGYDPYGEITVDRYFGAATAAAVRRWQQAEHLPETGEVELGGVIFAPGARRVTALRVSLGQDPPATGGLEEEEEEEEEAAQGPSAEETAAEANEPSGEEGEASQKPGGGKPREEEKEEEAKEEGSNESPTDAPKAGEPQGEETAGGAPGGSEGSGESEGGESPGSGSAAPEPVLGTTSTRQLVRVELSAADQSLAHVGEKAPVTLPDGSIVKGRITKVGTVAEGTGGGGPEGGGEEGEATISVTLALNHPVARLDEAPVSVALVKQVRRHVLAVPATALFATAGGGYAVEALKGDRRMEIEVTPGMFADGYVQVEGQGLHAGLKVTEPTE